MKYLLIPSRHILYSKDQENFILDHIRNNNYDKIIFAITSYNLTNCKYSPFDLVARTLLISKILEEILNERDTKFTICKIPHTVNVVNFPENTIKHIFYETGLELKVTDTDVLTMGKILNANFVKSGFKTFFCDGLNHLDLFQGLFLKKDAVYFKANLGKASEFLFQNMSELLKRAEDIWTDPILQDTGGLTDNRNYLEYAFDMSNESMINVKFNDIKEYIREGKILDDGCADAALFIPISKHFKDSDLLGVDISDEFIARAKERVRAGFYGQNFVEIIQGNITKPMFRDFTIDTVMCNSTMHEIWSYNNKLESVLEYLKLKKKQLVNGGRIVIRDVIGPEEKYKKVFLRDLENPERVEDFLRDFGHIDEGYFGAEIYSGNKYFKMTLKLASEYLLHKDYLQNWKSEMKEEFCHFNKEDWVKVLIETGFKVVEVKSYASEWILKNRLEGKIELLDTEFEKLEFPETNCVVVGEK